MNLSCKILCFLLPLEKHQHRYHAGQELPASTPGSSVGTSKLKNGIVLVGAVKIAPLKDCIDDTTGIFDGDTFSGSVPSGVYKVSLSAALFHLLNKLFCIFGRMQLQECLAEASREGRSRLCDSTLGTCKFCGEIQTGSSTVSAPELR